MEESQVVTVCAALAHPTRLRMVRTLVVAGPDGLPAGVLSGRIGVPASTLSAHLTRLEHAGLIAARRQSRHIYYRIVLPALAALAAYLIQDCCAEAETGCALPEAPDDSAGPAGDEPAA